MTSITDSTGSELTVKYSFSGISEVNYEGNRHQYIYNFDGFLIESRKYLNSTTFTSTYYTYYPDGTMESVVDIDGQKTLFYYDNGFVQSLQQPSNASDLSVSYQFDISNYKTQVNNPEIGTTHYQMNSNYVIQKIIDPLEQITSYDSFDANYNPTQITDIDGKTSTYMYDLHGNLIEEIDSEGNITTYTYNDYNDVLTITDKEGTTTQEYDNKGNLIVITEPNGKFTQFYYDEYGNITKGIFPDDTTETYSYDNTGNREHTITDQLGRTTVKKSDVSGNVTSIIDPIGTITNYNYTQDRLLSQVKDHFGNITAYEYDANENLKTIINANGKKVDLTYNNQNQLVSRKEPMGQTTNFIYDENGNKISIEKPKDGNNTIKIFDTYNDINQLQSTSVNGLEKWTYSYDEGGNLKTVKDVLTGDMKYFEYNQNNYIIKETRDNNSTKYEYNDMDKLISISGDSINSSFKQSYLLDNQGWLKEIQRNGIKHASINYSEKGVPSSIIYGNGIESLFGYNATDQLSTLSVVKGESSIFEEEYSYDLNGNIISASSTNGINEFKYSMINQLLNHKLPNGKNESFEYDSVGNRVKKVSVYNGESKTINYTYNDNNQLINTNGIAYLYNANGSRIQDNRYKYIFNEFDQLIELKSLTDQTIATYSYDVEGRRISKNINDITTFYHYNQGINVMYETDDNGVITTEYSYDQNGYPLTMTKNEVVYYYVLNGHKDVIALANEFGEIVASYTYDAWGNILSQNGSMAESNPYRYAGYRYDEESKFYYLTERYYDPIDGVFLTRDSHE